MRERDRDVVGVAQRHALRCAVRFPEVDIAAAIAPAPYSRYATCGVVRWDRQAQSKDVGTGVHKTRQHRGMIGGTEGGR